MAAPDNQYTTRPLNCDLNVIYFFIEIESQVQKARALFAPRSPLL
jgi:hypothetical protein